MNHTCKRYLTVALWPVLLASCASQTMPLDSTFIDATGNVITRPAGYTRDASVAKEHEVHETLRHRDLMYSQAYQYSGFTMDYKEVRLAGGAVAFLPVVSFRETPRFEQPLPTAPSAHPVWGFANNLVDKGLWGFLGYNLFKFGRAAIDGAAERNTYNGPYAPNNSGNTNTVSGQGGSMMPWEVRPEIVKPEVVRPEVIMPTGP